MPDKALLSDFRENGDLEILGVLYSRYMHRVYGVCIRYLKDRETARDEVINIFEKLAYETGLADIENFKTWLYVVTKNHCLMVLRSRKSETERMTTMINDPVFFMENSNEMHPLDSNDGTEKERLEECMAKLREEQRKCVTLFYYENKCYREISDMLGMDEKKVKSYLQNGKRNLKICLEGKNVTGKEIY